MPALLFILGLLSLCLLPPVGILLILLAVAWAIVFPKQIKVVTNVEYRRDVAPAERVERRPAKQYQLTGNMALVMLLCFIAVCVVSYYWQDLSRWSVLHR